jgi:tetratricopeptide (TPR) repeat protein
MYNNLGLAYEYLGEPLKAHQAYRSALRVDPAYELAWYNLGLLSVQLGNNDQATEAMNRLKEIKPYLAGQLAAAMAH